MEEGVGEWTWVWVAEVGQAPKWTWVTEVGRAPKRAWVSEVGWAPKGTWVVEVGWAPRKCWSSLTLLPWLEVEVGRKRKPQEPGQQGLHPNHSPAEDLNDIKK